MNLARTADAYTRSLEDDARMALWHARLADGTTVLADDGRPGVQPASAWRRLRQYCHATGCDITAFWLAYRSNVQRGFLPDEAWGYYFCRSSLAQLGASGCLHFYLIGALLPSGLLLVHRLLVPELLWVDSSYRAVDAADERLILNRRGREWLSSGMGVVSSLDESPGPPDVEHAAARVSPK